MKRPENKRERKSSRVRAACAKVRTGLAARGPAPRQGPAPGLNFLGDALSPPPPPPSQKVLILQKKLIRAIKVGLKLRDISTKQQLEKFV
jgi:hypothetical protein